MLRTTILSAAFLALGACASGGAGAPPGDRECFRNADVYGYNVIDDHTVSVRANGRDYHMRTLWDARDLDWSRAIVLRSDTTWICTGSGLGVEVIGGEPARRYPIQEISRAPEPAAPAGS